VKNGRTTGPDVHSALKTIRLYSPSPLRLNFFVEA
jgi:hypothetical protein